MPPHIHISALQVVVTGLSAVVFIGTAKVIARKFEGHPFANAWLETFC